MKLETMIDGMLKGMANMDLYSQAKCLHHDRIRYPELARELEKHLSAEVIEIASRIEPGLPS